MKSPTAFVVVRNNPKIQKAFQAVFPSSAIATGSFYILHLVWVWLNDPEHSIQKENRAHLLQFFRKVVFAETPQDCEKRLKELCELCKSYPDFVK